MAKALFSLLGVLSLTPLGQGREFAIARPFATPAEVAALHSSFDAWEKFLPCSGATAHPVDLFLVFSRDLNEDAAAAAATKLVVDDFDKGNQAWHSCFRALRVLSAKLTAAEDIYDPTAADTNPNWVRGPNSVFRFLLSTFMESAYSHFFLMELDSWPQREHWLEQLFKEAAVPGVAIRGSRYRGDNWDDFLPQMPDALRAHINGNAIYNVKHPFMSWLSQQLHQQANDSVAFDVRMAELTLQVKDTPGFKDWASENGDAYFSDSMLIGNYANTLLNSSFDGGEYIAHGARSNVLSDLSDTQVTLAVHHFNSSNFSLFEGTLTTAHPFRQIIVLTPDPPAPDKTELLSTPLGQTSLTWKTQVNPVTMALCELARLVTTDFFVYTDTYHGIAAPVYVLMNGARPVLPFVRAESQYCASDPRCVASLQQAKELFNVTLPYHYETFDTLWRTADARSFCADWDVEEERLMLEQGGQSCLPLAGPSADDYMAWRSLRGELAQEYAQENRELKGWRVWTFLHTAHPPDPRPCGTYKEMQHAWSIANISSCSAYVEQPDACQAQTACMWRPMFRSGKCVSLVENVMEDWTITTSATATSTTSTSPTATSSTTTSETVTQSTTGTATSSTSTSATTTSSTTSSATTTTTSVTVTLTTSSTATLTRSTTLTPTTSVTATLTTSETATSTPSVTATSSSTATLTRSTTFIRTTSTTALLATLETAVLTTSVTTLLTSVTVTSTATTSAIATSTMMVASTTLSMASSTTTRLVTAQPTRTTTATTPSTWMSTTSMTATAIQAFLANATIEFTAAGSSATSTHPATSPRSRTSTWTVPASTFKALPASTSSAKPSSSSTVARSTSVPGNDTALSVSTSIGAPDISRTSSTTTTTERSISSNVASDAASVHSQHVGNVMQHCITQLPEGNESVVVTSSLGKVKVVNLTYAMTRAEKTTKFQEGGGGVVTFPASALREIPANAVLAMLSLHKTGQDANTTEEGDPFSLLGPLASKVMDISVFNSDGKRVPVTLTEPLLFKLPGNGTRGRCVFLDTDGIGPATWSTRGVWTASDADVLAIGENATGIWCFTTHLSIFAALEQALLGCTNMELFSPRAVAAFVDNEGWYDKESAFIIWLVWITLAVTLIIGLLWEQWALRLGATQHVAKNLNICRGFMTWGPHVLKHKYAVFVVFARDVLQFMTTNKATLKNQVLTASCQRFLAVRKGISLGTVQQHCWNGSDWLNSDVSLPYTVVCRKLEFHSGTAERVIQDDIFAHGPLGVLRRFVLTFLAINPLLDAIRVGHGSFTVGKRATLQIASVSGVIATNALIFTFSGEFRAWEADVICPIPSESFWHILVATTVSILVNMLPVSFLTDLAKQVYGRPLWIAAFWAMLLAYLSTTGLLITLALANMNPVDQDLWYKALEWGIIVKLVGMPLGQTVRNCVLLEAFLRKDRSCKASQRFRVTMGLSHPNERELSLEARDTAEKMAMQAISAEELVRFTSMLGDVIMTDFDPETSTSDDVMRAAIEPLCIHAPALERYPISIEVHKVSGLQKSEKQLTCSILHLGEQLGNERVCLNEAQSDVADVGADGGHWAFEATFSGIEVGHFLGFKVVDVDGREVGIAALCMEQVMSQCGWTGSLPLQSLSTTTCNSDRFTMPTEAGPVPCREVAGSHGPSLWGRSHIARLEVSVHLPEGYMAAVARHELLKIKSQGSHEPVSSQMMSLFKTSSAELDWALVTSAGAFCEARAYNGERLPPEKMVVHSRKGKFADLVTSVILDALGEQEDYGTAFKSLQALIMNRDYCTLEDILQENKRSGTRYWIEMFAINPMEVHNPETYFASGVWHEDFLHSWPTILRAMRRFSAHKMVSDINAGIPITPPLPLMQLLVLDRDFHFMHESSCLAELMLAKAMRVRQRLVLHPEHLNSGGGLGVELRRLAKELSDAYNEQEVSYMAPHLEDRQAVFETVRDLAVKGVTEHREDDESTWKELDMTDVSAVLVANQVGRITTTRQGQDGDNVQMEEVGCDADV